MVKPASLVPDEILPHLFRNTPVLIDVIDHDGLITHVNPRFEQLLGWTQREIMEHQPDVLAECFPILAERRRALAFIQAAGGEWATFKLRTRTGRELPMAWAEFPLSGRRVLGIGVLEQEHRVLTRETEAYLRRLLMPIPKMDADAQPKLMSVVQRGLELALLLWVDGRSVQVTMPVEVVDLAARYGSADLIIRMVQRAVSNGGD